MSTKISDYDSDSEKKLLKIVLSVSLGIIFITTIVCALLFYKPWSLLNKAEKAFKARKWVIAISEYNATIDYNTRSSSFIIENKLEKIYFDLIEACVQKQDDTALVDACFKLIDQFPDNYDYAFKVADILEKNELTADALEIYEIIKKRGDDKAISIAEKHCSRLSSETFGENTNENDEDEEYFRQKFPMTV
jgi:tetratricopeptide (TPR) repeat protein